ncbi:MAG: hypothetical protein KA310_11905 [Pseudomonadales bacterium]|nr:hypothetical protein [Pseudomonadales bacterium]
MLRLAGDITGCVIHFGEYTQHMLRHQLLARDLPQSTQELLQRLGLLRQSRKFSLARVHIPLKGVALSGSAGANPEQPGRNEAQALYFTG